MIVSMVLGALAKVGIGYGATRLGRRLAGGEPPNEKPPGMFEAAIAIGTAMVVVLLFLTGKVPVQNFIYPLLYGFGFGVAILGVTLLWLGIRRSRLNVMLGLFLLTGGVFLVTSLPMIFMANAPGKFLGEKVAGVCAEATDLWEQRPEFEISAKTDELEIDLGEVDPASWWEKHKPGN